MNVAGTGLIVLLMALVGADVASRNLANAPISGVPELVTLSIVAIVFLQAPKALRAGRFTRSDGVIGWLHATRPGLARGMETLFDLTSAAVIGVIFYASLPIFQRAWSRGDFIGAVGDFTAPTWPVKLMVLAGSAVLVCQFLARILRRHLGARP